MKPLKPSMRENKRYLFLIGENLKENVEKAIFDFVGILGMSKLSPSWIKLEKNSGILSINRESLNHVRASFCIFEKRIEIKKVSGTLKALAK